MPASSSSSSSSSGSGSKSGSQSSSSSSGRSSRSSASSGSSDRSALPPPPKKPDAGKAAKAVLPPAPKRDSKPKDSASRKEPQDVEMKDAPKPRSSKAHEKSSLKPGKENGQADDGACKRLHVGRLTRNVQQEHVREIFSCFGTLKSVELAVDKMLKLTRGFAYVEYESLEGAKAAIAHMDGGQLDGAVVQVQYMPQVARRDPLPAPRQARHSSPSRRPRDDPRSAPRDPLARDRDRDRGVRPSASRRHASPARGLPPGGSSHRDRDRDRDRDRGRRPASPPRRSRRDSPRRRASPPRRSRLPSPPRDSRRRRSPERRRSPARKRTRSPAPAERKPAAKRRSDSSSSSSSSSSSGGSASSRSSGSSSSSD